jgi:hypothetical protein
MGFLIVFCGKFGFAGLWHTMVEIPQKLPWLTFGDLRNQIQDYSSLLIGYVGIPCFLMIGFMKKIWNKHSLLLLPTLTYICLMPLAIATLFKVGGAQTALEIGFVWIVPALAILIGIIIQKFKWAIVIVMFAIMGLVNWEFSGHPSIVPEVSIYKEAAYLARRAPRACWFPLNPLVTLLSEEKYYHDEDGLYERKLSKNFPNHAHLEAGLPFAPRAVILPRGWTTWGIAVNITSGSGKALGRPFGRWIVIGSNIDGKLP